MLYPGLWNCLLSSDRERKLGGTQNKISDALFNDQYKLPQVPDHGYTDYLQLTEVFLSIQKA